MKTEENQENIDLKPKCGIISASSLHWKAAAINGFSVKKKLYVKIHDSCSQH